MNKELSTRDDEYYLHICRNPIEDHSDAVEEPMVQESGLLGQHEDFQG